MGGRKKNAFPLYNKLSSPRPSQAICRIFDNSRSFGRTFKKRRAPCLATKGCKLLVVVAAAFMHRFAGRG